MAEMARYNDASVTNQYQYDNAGFAAPDAHHHHHNQYNRQPQQPDPMQPKPFGADNSYVFVSERRYMEPLKGGVAPRSDDGNSSRLSNARSLDSVDDMSRGSRSQASDRTTDLEMEPIERMSYLSGDSMFSGTANQQCSGIVAPVLMKPSLIKQHQQQLRDDQLNRSSYHTPPDELRSQLPWSYFQDRDEISRPLKQRKEADNDVLPPVPVPDYTLHFPKKERPATKPKPARSATAQNQSDDNYDANGNESEYI